MPPGACLVAKAQTLEAIACAVLCLAENWEAFADLHRYAWLDTRQQRVLVVFRGDNRYSAVHAKSLLEARTEPIWAFVDFDPAGLGIAAGLPAARVERVVLPPLGWLKQASNTLIGRGPYDAQVGQWRGTLDASSSPAIHEAWAHLGEWGAGVTQERMLACLDRL